jgi:hypothetical protein
MVASFINYFHPNLLFKNIDRRKLCALYSSWSSGLAQREARGNECVVNVTVSLPPYSFFDLVHVWSNRKILAGLFVNSLIRLYRLQRLFSAECANRMIVKSKLVEFVKKTADSGCYWSECVLFEDTIRTFVLRTDQRHEYLKLEIWLVPSE